MEIKKHTLLIIIFSTVFFSNTVLAFNNSDSPSAIQNVPLLDVLKSITEKSGINFKINTDISKTNVKPSILANDWFKTIQNLLVGYNWVVIQEGNQLKNVIISSQNAGYSNEISENPQASFSIMNDTIETNQEETEEIQTQLISKYHNGIYDHRGTTKEVIENTQIFEFKN